MENREAFTGISVEAEGSVEEVMAIQGKRQITAVQYIR